jgi:hypothetical protein
MFHKISRKIMILSVAISAILICFMYLKDRRIIDLAFRSGAGEKKRFVTSNDVSKKQNKVCTASHLS